MEEDKYTVFDKYETGRLLGKGTFAKVYHGKQIFTGERVAIEIVNKEQVRKEGMMEQIKREISVMQQLARDIRFWPQGVVKTASSTPGVVLRRMSP